MSVEKETQLIALTSNVPVLFMTEATVYIILFTPLDFLGHRQGLFQYFTYSSTF